MADIVDPAIRLERLIRRQEPQFATGFIVLISQMKDAADLQVIEELLTLGNLEGALTEALRRAPNLGNLYLASFVTAAQETAGFLNKNLEQIVIDFDQTNPFAVQVARENQLRMVSQFTQQQREATRQALINGIQRGNNPRAQARAFVDSVGLTRNQVTAVENYRQLLEQGSRQALNRTLRDRRFDRTIQRAIDNDTPLSALQIDRMTDRYRERFLQHRSQVIARTEALGSVHKGSHQAYLQAIETGALDPNNLTSEWNTAKDEAVRGSHADMHGQKVPFNQPFTSGAGNQALHPGGFGVASEDIQCRCSVGTRIAQAPVPQGLEFEIIS